MRSRFLHILMIALSSWVCSSSCSKGGGTTGGGPTRNPPGFTIDDWHWRNPLPQGNTLFDVTYANGTYIAVGDAGTILNFADGLEYSGVYLSIRSVASGNGTVVAVGGGDAILTSQTGRTWTLQKPHKTTLPRMDSSRLVSVSAPGAITMDACRPPSTASRG